MNEVMTCMNEIVNHLFVFVRTWLVCIFVFLAKAAKVNRQKIFQMISLHGWAHNGATTNYRITRIISIPPKTTQEF